MKLYTPRDGPHEYPAAPAVKNEGRISIGKDDAARALAGDDENAVAGAVISATLSISDDKWVLAKLEQLVKHDSAVVRSAAARSCGHLARIHGVDEARAALLKLMLEPLTRDPATSDAAREALDNVETFSR